MRQRSPAIERRDSGTCKEGADDRREQAGETNGRCGMATWVGGGIALGIVLGFLVGLLVTRGVVGGIGAAVGLGILFGLVGLIFFDHQTRNSIDDGDA